jgi:hypothetical protein
MGINAVPRIREHSMRLLLISRCILLFVVFLCGCNGSPSGPTHIAQGVWGGDHVNLNIGKTSSHLEFDCAHGDIPDALSADGGSFSIAGTFVREHGGPIRIDEPLDLHPAVYAGTLTGNMMRLTVRLTDSNESIGSFTLAQGVSGRVLKCL